MRLIKIFIPFSIFCFSFIFSFSSAKAVDTADFSSYADSFSRTVYYDFNEILAEKDYGYLIYDNSTSVSSRSSTLIFFKNENFSNLRLEFSSTSSALEYKLYNFSENSFSFTACSFSFYSYDSETSSSGKAKCLEEINSGKFKSSFGKGTSLGYNFGYFPSSSYSNKYFPFYISNEDIELIAEGVSVKFNNEIIAPENITVKDLFYANHNGLFEEKTFDGHIDLSNVEKLLYFICFVLFAFFIILIFKIAIRFIHMILPI